MDFLARRQGKVAVFVLVEEEKRSRPGKRPLFLASSCLRWRRPPCQTGLGGFNSPFLALLPLFLSLLDRLPFLLDGCLFPSLVRGVADDVTGETTCRHWLPAEPPSGYVQCCRDGGGCAHARSQVLLYYTSIRHPPTRPRIFLLSNPPK